MSRAKEFGHYYGNEEWANFGQGAPETGHLLGQPDRNFSFVFNDRNAEYASVDGVFELRQKVFIFFIFLFFFICFMLKN